MPAQESNPEGGTLTVTPVLVEDRSHFRQMALGAALVDAHGLAKTIEQAKAYHWCHGRVTVRDERRIKDEMADLRSSLELLEQVGWREPRSEDR